MYHIIIDVWQQRKPLFIWNSPAKYFFKRAVSKGDFPDGWCNLPSGESGYSIKGGLKAQKWKIWQKNYVKANKSWTPKIEVRKPYDQKTIPLSKIKGSVTHDVIHQHPD